MNVKSGVGGAILRHVKIGAQRVLGTGSASMEVVVSVCVFVDESGWARMGGCV
jgi:hypothetical protein